MTKRLSPDDELEILRYYLIGMPRDEIAAKMSVAAGTVTNVVQRYAAKLEKGELEAVRFFALECKRRGGTIGQAFHGLRIYNLLETNHLNEDQAFSLIVKVQKECKKYNITFDELSEYVFRLFQLKDKTELPLEEIPNYVQKLLQEKTKLEQDITIAQNDVTNINKEKEQVVREKNIIIQNLNEYVTDKNKLRQLGADVNDYYKLAVMLKQAKDSGFNYGVLVKRIREEQRLKQSIIELQRTASNLEEQIDKLVTEEKELEKSVRVKHELLDQINKFETRNIKHSHVQAIFDKVITISKKRKIKPKAALEKLTKDVAKHYDPILGFEQRIDSLRKEMDDLIANFKAQKIEKRRGIEEQRNAISALAIKIRKLKDEITQFKDEREKLKAEIEHVREYTTAQINSVTDAARNSIELVGANANTRINEEAQNAQKQLETSIDPIVQKIWEAAQEYSEMRSWKVIARIVKEAKGEKDEVIPVTLTLCDRLARWAQHYPNKNIHRFLRQLVFELQKEMNIVGDFGV